MSVLVKGMGMPKCCADCPFCYDNSNIDEEWFFCSAHDYAPRILDRNGCRLALCPLVEVTAPHGDLIERDYIDNAIRRIKRITKGEAGRVIYNAPTIIEAEE